MIAPPPLRVENLTFSVGAARLLDGITLTIPPGSMTALLGPNGAGKTTLIRSLAGIVPASSGDVYLGTQRLRTLGRSAVARVCGYLPQHTGTSFEIQVQDVVALGRYPHLGTWRGLSRADYERVHWAMERVGLGDLRNRTLPTLSGGERQRVFVARALVQEAPILLLDEPITGLDIGRQLELMALLSELHREGHTILAALHDLKSALDHFPRAVVLDKGRLVDDGPTGRVVFGSPLRTAFGVRVEPGEGLTLHLSGANPCDMLTSSPAE